MTRDTRWLRPVVGFVSAVALIAVVAMALALFAGGFNKGVPVTIVAQRAGLVMNPDAKVKLLGVPVGQVDSIEKLPDGRAALHLSIEPAKVDTIPANVTVDIAATTVFGAKYVNFVLPADPSGASIRRGQILDAQQVTVEVNTVFDQLTSILDHIDPVKLNESLGAITRALSGRGRQVGQSLRELDAMLTDLDPALTALSHDIAAAPGVLTTYADTAPDLLRTATNATRLSVTLVDQQNNLDAVLMGAIGLSDVGTNFMSDNGGPLADTLRELNPTTSLLDEYSPALNCGLLGMLDLANVTESFPTSAAGITVSVNFLWGHERYRYPSDLPKVAASGGPRCEVLPVKYQQKPPYVVTDTGVNPFKRGNQNLLINSDGLKQLLFGPLDGPPRNTGQIGQPG